MTRLTTRLRCSLFGHKWVPKPKGQRGLHDSVCDRCGTTTSLYPREYLR